MIGNKCEESNSVEWWEYVMYRTFVTNKFGILKNGKVTEFTIPQIEVKNGKV